MKLRAKQKFFVFAILLFFFINNISFSQSYSVRNYSIESGIPSRYVSDVTQDIKGRLWIATANGISVYDGFQWINLDKGTGLPSIKYRKVKADEKGIVWCIPNYICESVVYFENDSMKTIASPVKMQSNDMLSITAFDMFYENNKPFLCVGSTNGIYVYKDSEWTNYNTNNGLINNNVYSVVFNKNKFYISTCGGISILNGNKIDNSLCDIFTSKYSEVLAVAFDKDDSIGTENKMWVLGKKWIGWLQNKELKILNDKFVLPTGKEAEHPSLVTAKNDLIFCSNYYFAFCINKNTGEIFPLTNKQGFNSDGCTSVFIDNEENIWQTGTRGIDKVSNLCFVNYNINNGLLDNEVSSILEYDPGKFIFGHNTGITIYNKNKITLISFPENKLGYPGDSRVMDICKGKDGITWLACLTRGLGKLEKNGSIKWIKFNDGNNAVNSVAMDENGIIWIASNYGLYVVKNDRLVESADLNIKKKFYRRIVFMNNGDLIFASNNGLNLKSGKNIKHFSVEGNDRANNIFSVFEDKNNKVFVGTTAGLYCLKNDSYEKYYENDFKIDISVYSILQDNLGNYWFGTDDGVIKWDGKNKGVVYTKGNGLSGRETNRTALINDSKGNVWIGTESGLTCYRPAFDKNTIPVPKILMLNVEDAEGNKYSLTQNTDLNSKNNTLFFNFRGISYYNEDFIQYKIKLEGFDADWYVVNQSHIDKIRYTNLIPRDYKLLVSAKNVSGEWSDIIESAIITIEKPFYQKWWFYILFFLTISILLYHLYKLYIISIYRRNLEKQVSERTSELRETEKELRNSQTELEDKVIERTSKLAEVNEQLKEINESKDKFFSIIAHDMKSPFTGLLGYSELMINEVEVMDKEKFIKYAENLHKNLKYIYNLLENLLNWASLQTGRMTYNPELVDLYLLIQDIVELLRVNSNTKNITLRNQVALNTNVKGDKNMLRTVIYNLVSNAIKFTNKDGIVLISSRNLDGFIEISVSDNGVGIPKENLNMLFKLASKLTTKGTAMEKGTGLGLLLCKEMIDKHNGKISVESEEGKGTTFKVILTV